MTDVANVNNHNTDIIIDNNGTINDTFDRLSITERNTKNNNKLDDTIIYRYKFTDDFTCELSRFAKVHQYDHRTYFKEAWKIWLEENKIIVNEETRRLANLGYHGDIEDKMFKSARYYFRKKGTEKKAPNERRPYFGARKELLEAMDSHIARRTFNKPSDSFEDFCKNNEEILTEEIDTLLENGFTDTNEIKKKLIKTYKNRYFFFISK